jgi:hypothetical protein
VVYYCSTNINFDHFDGDFGSMTIMDDVSDRPFRDGDPSTNSHHSIVTPRREVLTIYPENSRFPVITIHATGISPT